MKVAGLPWIDKPDEVRGRWIDETHEFEQTARVLMLSSGSWSVAICKNCKAQAFAKMSWLQRDSPSASEPCHG